GFEAISRRIERRDPRVSLGAVRWLLRAVVKVRFDALGPFPTDRLTVCCLRCIQARDGLDAAFLKKYVEPLQTSVANLILELSDEELKSEDKKVLAEITLQMEILLRAVLPHSKASAQIEQFRLNLALRCFRSPYLEKRLLGLNDIKDLISP